MGADPYCESGLKAIFFRASGAKQSFSSWWEHLNLHVISCVETLLGRNLYENFLCASGAIRYLRTHRISMSTVHLGKKNILSNLTVPNKMW